MLKLMRLCYPLLLLFSAQILAQAPSPLGYESAEHIFMGDQVVLKGLPLAPHNQSVPLPLTNGLVLAYGDIIAMPDYYGDPNHQISSEPTLAGRKQQFAKLFQSFSQYNVAYFNAFWPIIQNEEQQVAATLKAHESVSALYKKIMDKEMLELEVATHGQYIALAARCFDHFGQNAWLAYQAGHSDAIDTAISGHDILEGKNNRANAQCQSAQQHQTCLKQLATDTLKIAYEENAYANHFLTDRFASGHMRTPFKALITTRPISALGGIAGSYMHNEDNRYGVIVTNRLGAYWIAYGDDYYFSENNTYHRAQIKAVIQKSADEIYAAFVSGYDTDPLSTQLQNLLPSPIEPGKTVLINGIGQATQSAPLFKVISGAVWERKDVNNPYDDEWVQNWSTIELMLDYKLDQLSGVWKQYLKEHPEIANILPRSVLP